MRPRPLDSELARFVSAGALGGGINAWLCYAGIPVVVSDTYVKVAWHLVPAGAVHGAVLALAALLATRWARRRGWPARVGAAVAAGWIAGYVSWEVLLLSLNENFTGIAWPFDDDVSGILLGPFNSFGLVVTTYCLVALLHSGREGSTARRC
ncbi:MAG TPA: hypothetical protein VFO19_20830 [Vicinamibacterales bacterium]|nr:hypothetical protein [Vicinamibacterales bacterium]